MTSANPYTSPPPFPTNSTPFGAPPKSPPLSPYNLSPHVIFLIVALGTVVLAASYYQILLRIYPLCRRLRRGDPFQDSFTAADDSSCEDSNSGIDPSVIARIPLLKYDPSDARIPSAECSVCLMEFCEAEFVRILPKCRHAFHVACIARWLQGHSTCPLCRADVIEGFFGSSSPEPKDEECATSAGSGSRGVEPRDSRGGSGRSTSDLMAIGDGASSSQWPRRFRWSRPVGARSQEEMRAGLLQTVSHEGYDDGLREVAIDLSRPWRERLDTTGSNACGVGPVFSVGRRDLAGGHE